MSGIPRTGLFSRNHVASLAQRNRALKAENVNNNGKVEETGSKGETIESPMGSPASSSFASLPRDNEGFDDLEAYFDRANTPQKTPKSTRKSQHNTPTRQAGSKADTPLTQRKNASVLLAKPVKLMTNKFAERYKIEPRLAVSMSEAIEETREREREQAAITEKFNAVNESTVPTDMADSMADNMADEMADNMVNNMTDNMTDSMAMPDGTINDNYNNFTDAADHTSEEDRIQKAKRELEEMSINSFDSTINNVNEDDTEVHLSTYIKSTLSNVTTETKEEEIHNHQSYNNEEYAMPDDDVLMDRLVEEMLVNDSDLPDPVSKNDGVSVYEEPIQKTVKKTGQPRKPRKATSGGGLTRRPMTYLPGAEYTESGQRRSCRLKIEPLRYWANEKVCYGRADDPSITLPVIVNVIKKPELDDPTFAMGLTRKRRRPVDGNVSKLKAQAFGPDCDVETEVNCYDRPGEEEMRLVALSHHHVQGDPVKDCSFRIHTIFTEGTYMSSGQLIFPPLSQKPTKNSARHALVFYVITGSFRVEINKESFLVGPGGQFHVPRANHYTITHVTEDRSVEGRLFFCHCKDNAE